MRSGVCPNGTFPEKSEEEKENLPSNSQIKLKKSTSVDTYREGFSFFSFLRMTERIRVFFFDNTDPSNGVVLMVSHKEKFDNLILGASQALWGNDSGKILFYLNGARISSSDQLKPEDKVYLSKGEGFHRIEGTKPTLESVIQRSMHGVGTLIQVPNNTTPIPLQERDDQLKKVLSIVETNLVMMSGPQGLQGPISGSAKSDFVIPAFVGGAGIGKVIDSDFTSYFFVTTPDKTWI
jgi:hypothetical protein